MPAPGGIRIQKAKYRSAAGVASTQPTAAASGRGGSEDADVAQLAYSYWEARGHTGGSPEEDWLRAEQQLRSGRQA
jgi:hypothetical protein